MGRGPLFLTETTWDTKQSSPGRREEAAGFTPSVEHARPPQKRKYWNKTLYKSTCIKIATRQGVTYMPMSISELLGILERSPLTEVYVPGFIDDGTGSRPEKYLPPGGRQFHPMTDDVYLEVGDRLRPRRRPCRERSPSRDRSRSPMLRTRSRSFSSPMDCRTSARPPTCRRTWRTSPSPSRTGHRR
jgi:hypothetical protein